MKKEYILKGLDCPHCAKEIEEEIKKIENVGYAEVNLIKESLIIEVADGKGISEKIEKAVHKYEPKVEVIEKNTEIKEKTKEKNNKGRFLRLAVGGAIFIGVMCLTHIFDGAKNVGFVGLLLAYVILGADVLMNAIRNILKGRIFDENFLMGISTIGAFLIGEYPEAIAVMLFYQIGEFFQSIAVQRSRKSIKELMDICPEYANVRRNGEIIRVSPDRVKEGEIIVIKAGEKIPLDAVITEGNSRIDTKALTGESLPKSVREGDEIISGCINISGVLTAEVKKTAENSTVAKILNMVENASSKKAPAENFITTFSKYYTPVVVIGALILGIIPPLFFGGEWTEWVRRSFVFLVISCPCALVISVPLAFFGGIGEASRKGILVKGGNYLEALNKVNTMIFDKTGTLTKGNFNVTNIIPKDGVSEEELLNLAFKAECFSNHPIAKSIMKMSERDINKDEICEYTEVSGNGVIVKTNGKIIIAGNSKLFRDNSVDFEENESIGTKVYIAENGEYKGCIVISDEIKADSEKAIKLLKDYGIFDTIMLTGDNKEIGKAVSEKLGIKKCFCELLPNEKVEKVEEIFQSDGKTAFVGDGINDAPVLARADVGIAMGGLGSDAAIEAADIVIMTDEPSKIIEALKISRKTHKIVIENIIFSLGVKGAFLILGMLGIAGMWEAVFGDVGVMIIAVLNSMRILKK